MNRNRPFLVSVFLLLSVLSGYADVDTGWPCIDDASCLADLGNGVQFYCSRDTSTCFQVTATENATTLSTVPAAASTVETQGSGLDTRVAKTEQDIQTLDADLQRFKQDLTSIKNDLNAVQRHAAQISTDINRLSQSLATDVAPKVSQTLAGQAALQQDLNQTQAEVAMIEEDLTREQRFTRFLKVAFFTLLVVAVALLVIYYLNREKSPIKVTPEIQNYITAHIAKGRKFPAIKDELLHAGWNEEEITHAYKQTLKKNYQTYREKRYTAAAPAASFGYDRRKMMSIAVVSIVLIIGLFFLIGGVVGKAFFITRFVNTSSGEIIDVVECTPPQILTPAGDSCCTDANANSICDAAEREVEELQGEHCVDNFQCASGQLCINGQCSSLAGLYQGSSDCDKLCAYYALRVKTSDGESYSVKPNRGSYTAAGALEWKVLEMPKHCDGEAAIVPVSIIRKEPGKILSEEVITLRRGETSTALGHPSLPEVSFSLTLQNVYEICE